MPSKTKKSEATNFFLMILITTLVLLLTLINIYLFYNKTPYEDVLGSLTKAPEELIQLEVFLEEEPQYLPGWIEKARIEKNEGLIDSYNKSLTKIIHLEPNYNISF